MGRGHFVRLGREQVLAPLVAEDLIGGLGIPHHLAVVLLGDFAGGEVFQA
jgi:hypothetical protein